MESVKRSPSLRPGRFLGKEIGALSVGPLRITETVYSPRMALPDHSHQWPFLCFVIRGTYDDTAAHSVSQCDAGNIAYGPADVAHQSQFGPAGARCLNIALDPAWIADFPAGIAATTTHLYGGGPGARFLALRLYQEVVRPDSLSEMAIEGLSRALVAAVVRHQQSDEATAPPWLDRAVAIASVKFAEPIGVTAIAKRVGVHPNHVARMFKARLGCTVGEFIRRKRTEAVCLLLTESTLPLANVAYQAGFCDQSHMTRVFRDATGYTPAEYRRLAGSPSAGSSPLRAEDD